MATKAAAKKTPAKKTTKTPTITWQPTSGIHWEGHSSAGDTYHLTRRQHTDGTPTWTADVQLNEDVQLTFEQAQQVAEDYANE